MPTGTITKLLPAGVRLGKDNGAGNILLAELGRRRSFLDWLNEVQRVHSNVNPILVIRAGSAAWRCELSSWAASLRPTNDD